MLGGMRIVLLSGERGSGKTTALARLARAAREAGREPGGVLQPGVFAPDGSKTGSTWIDAASGASGEFGSNVRELGGPRWKLWSFSADGLERANHAVLEALERGADPVPVDEIGPLELRAGSGLLPALRALEARARAGTELDPQAGRAGTELDGPAPTGLAGPLVIVAVRAALADELAERLKAALVIPIDPSRRDAAFAELAALLVPSSPRPPCPAATVSP